MADEIDKLEAEVPFEQPYDSNDPDQVNKARKKAARKRTTRLRVIEAIMQQPDGRIWMYDVLERCHIFSTPFIQGDPHSTSFNCGEQNIGNMILADVLAANGELYVLMCKEAKEKQ